MSSQKRRLMSAAARAKSAPAKKAWWAKQNRSGAQSGIWNSSESFVTGDLLPLGLPVRVQCHSSSITFGELKPLSGEHTVSLPGAAHTRQGQPPSEALRLACASKEPLGTLWCFVGLLRAPDVTNPKPLPN